MAQLFCYMSFHRLNSQSYDDIAVGKWMKLMTEMKANQEILEEELMKMRTQFTECKVGLKSAYESEGMLVFWNEEVNT